MADTIANKSKEYNAIEFINGEILIYTGEFTDEDFEADKKLRSFKRAFILREVKDE